MHDSDSLYKHIQNKLEKQNSEKSASNSSIASSTKKSSNSVNELSPRSAIVDRTKNRSMLKEMLKDIRSSQTNSLNSNSSSYNLENEVLVLKKTESGAIILKEDESVRTGTMSDFYSAKSGHVASRNNTFDQNESYFEGNNVKDESESDEEDAKRLESFYKQEGLMHEHDFKNNTRSIHANSRPNSTQSRIGSRTNAIKDENRPKSAASSVSLSKNNEGGNDDHRAEVSLKNSSKDSLDKEVSLVMKDEIQGNVHDPLDHLEIKYSTPIPPTRSAPLFRRRIAYKKFLQKFNTTVYIEMNKNEEKVEEDKGLLMLEKGEELLVEEKVELLPEANSTVIEDHNDENEELIFNDEISEIKAEENEEEEEEESVDESLSPFMATNTSEEQSTLSNYYIRELMGSVSELTIIDPDILDAVQPVMNKMLKEVCRRCYLHSVGKFQPQMDDDGSTLLFFNKDDHLYKNEKIVMVVDGLELEQNAESEQSTEVSESASNDYFSYLKLNIKEDDNDENDDDKAKNARRVSISSEDSTILDSDERRNLNMDLKDELNLMRFFIVNAKLPSIATKMVGLKRSLELKKEERKAHSIKMLHDDYFFSEYDENSIFTSNRNRDPIFNNQNADTTKQQTNQQNKDFNNQNSKKPYKNRLKLEKENQVKKREERIKQMQKAFSGQKSQQKKNKTEKAVEKYKKPTWKSNIKVKLVPYNYKGSIESIPRLPDIKSAKSLPADRKSLSSAYRSERAKTAPLIAIASSGPIDERQKYPRPSTSKQPWGTIHHPPYGLGYQRMTDYEIKQSVNRLYYVPKKPDEQLRSFSCLPKEDFCDMIDRLTFGSSDKAADRCRTQEASIYREMGVLNSYAWKGYYTAQKF